MIDIAILFTCITAYEYEFDPNKSATSRDILYIFLTIYTLVGFVTNWFSGNLYSDFEKEIKGALAKTGSSTGERVVSIFVKICKQLCFFGLLGKRPKRSIRFDFYYGVVFSFSLILS